MKRKVGILRTTVVLALCVVAGTASVFAKTNAPASQSITQLNVRENQPIQLSLAAEEGYVLPAELTLNIGKTTYTVSTDGKNQPQGVDFDPETGVLTIAAKLVKEGDEIALSGAAQQETQEETKEGASAQGSSTPAPSAEAEEQTPADQPDPAAAEQAEEPSQTTETAETGASDGDNQQEA